MHQQLQHLTQSLDGNPALARRNRFAPLLVAVHADDQCWTVRFGVDPIGVETGCALAPTIELRAPAVAWAAYGAAVPPVGYQSLNGMLRVGHLNVSGDMLAFGRHLMLIEAVFAAMRGPPQPVLKPVPVGIPLIEAITGRYLNVDLAGRPHRIYFEESGPADGIPLLCLHTAGSDGRQFRAVLNDREITQTYRVISFDLPWHGKSSPPPGFEMEIYRLTTALYVDTVMTVVRALNLQKPVVMGCSIGGRAVLHLALAHGDHFRAAIGLQSGLTAHSGVNPALRDLELIHRPDVHGGDAAAASVACLMAPTSPSADRWETLWHYAQSGPGVFAGDLFYYMNDGELSGQDVAALRSGNCPLYLLTGEYDLSATPASTAELAKLSGAHHFEVMPGLGHFPMSEAPDRFLTYLRPILAKMSSAADWADETAPAPGLHAVPSIRRAL